MVMAAAACFGTMFFARDELELIQPHMAQKPVLRGEVRCACVAREVSVERGGMGKHALIGFTPITTHPSAAAAATTTTTFSSDYC